MDDHGWLDQLRRFRSSKDEFLGNDSHSPLGPVQRRTFKGLSYYRPDPRYRFEVELEPDAPQELRMPRTGGDEVVYTRVGTFTLGLPAGAVRLAAYDAGHEGELFLPFRDATSNKETYGAGRYLEAQALGDGRYLVDLNFAYHPFCYFNEAWTCPIPPFENHLKVPIEAGERLP